MRTDCSECGVCTVLSWGFSIVNGAILPFLALILGFTYHGKCTLQPYITLYLYVIAALSLINFTYSVTSACCLQRPLCVCYRTCNKSHCFCALLMGEILLNIAIFISLIAGSVWIYRIYDDIKNAAPWCDPTFYYLSFSLITTQWIMFVLQHAVACTQTYVRQDPRQDTSLVRTTSHVIDFEIIKQEENNNRHL